MRADEEDPNGPEAGTRFLAENRKKKDVIACSSGLQYRVIKEGDGLVRPGLDTKCACHYVGALLDGTQFDSSYEKGRPSTFRPDQVIKGWTEAMQLMVEGDKWEMFIPSDLAYGDRGRPPRIGGGDCLIFTMEIIKIKGGTVPVSKEEI